MLQKRLILLTAIVILTAALRGSAQDYSVYPPQQGTQLSAFSDPPPPPPAEFLPSNKKPQRLIPFQEEEKPQCPTTNGFTDSSAPLPGDVRPTFYFGIGLTALRRLDLNRQDVAAVTPPLGFTNQTFVDAQATPINFNFGVRGEIGVVVGPGAIEFSGFYLAPNPGTSTTEAATPIGVFFNGHAVPGFADGLWKDASEVSIRYSVGVSDAELNYRLPFGAGFDILAGIRYVDVNETMSIATEAPLGTTNYSFGVHSHILGPQLGTECELVLIPHVSLSFLAKGVVGVNEVDISHTLSQGNGVQGPGSNTTISEATGLIEVGLFANIWFNSRLKLHVGYEAMWLLHLPEAQQQINFNANLAAGSQDYNGSLFFHGPIFELQFAF